MGYNYAPDPTMKFNDRQGYDDLVAGVHTKILLTADINGTFRYPAPPASTQTDDKRGGENPGDGPAVGGPFVTFYIGRFSAGQTILLPDAVANAIVALGWGTAVTP
jgi:hypothetical protein